MNQCETERHEDRAGPYVVNDERACRSCYNKSRKNPDYKPQKPGPKPDPTKPYSRVNPLSKHYKDGPRVCVNGHFWEQGNYVERTDGRRVCLTCISDRKGEYCAAGLHLRSEHENKYGACRACQSAKMVHVRRKVKYDLTPEQFEDKLKSQDGRCTICLEDLDFEKHNGVCIDHDHACCPGEKTCGLCVRDILCDMCNKLLGNARENVEIMENAINYIETWK
jgi:hypothetical protein